MKSHEIGRFVITAVLAAAGSMILGAVFFHSGIFVPQRSAFEFTLGGILGGTIFSTFRFVPKTRHIPVLVGLLVIEGIAMRSTQWFLILRDILFFAALSSAIFFFATRFYNRLPNSHLARTLLLASLLSLSYGVATLILGVVILASEGGEGPDLVQSVYFNLTTGLLIGFGLGAGIELSNVVYPKQ